MPLEIRTLKLGEISDDESMLLFLGRPGKLRRTAFYSWLILGSDVPILVDTFVRNSDGISWKNKIRTKPEWTFDAQLGKAGIRKSEIGIVVHTHLHLDHCGNDSLFPNAKIYVQRRELEYAATQNDPQTLALFDRRDVGELVDRFRERLVLLDGDTRIGRGVMCVRVGGHTPGSQAVYVETIEGTAIITGDVCYLYENLEKNIPTGIFFRYDECIAAMQKFRRDGRWILVGHDLQVYQRFPRILLKV